MKIVKVLVRVKETLLLSFTLVAGLGATLVIGGVFLAELSLDDFRCQLKRIWKNKG